MTKSGVRLLFSSLVACIVGAGGCASGMSNAGDGNPDLATHDGASDLATPTPDAASDLALSSSSDLGTTSDLASDLSNTGSPDLASGSEVVIFQQPTLAGIAGHFKAARCTTGEGDSLVPTPGLFLIESLQCPNTGAGFVTDDQDESALTGFNPNGGVNLGLYQYGYANTAAASVAQMGGDVVGVYMDSSDLYPSCVTPADKTKPGVGCKMMMTPQINFAPSQYMPFAKGGTAIEVSFLMQIPVAHVAMNSAGSSATNADSDLLFVDSKSGTHFSIGMGVFRLPTTATACYSAPDPDTGDIMVNCPLLDTAAVKPYVTMLAGTSPIRTEKFDVMTQFAYSIDATQFSQMLTTAKMAGATGTFSSDPADYYLLTWHHNTEIAYYERGTTTMSYALKDLKIAMR